MGCMRKGFLQTCLLLPCLWGGTLCAQALDSSSAEFKSDQERDSRTDPLKIIKHIRGTGGVALPSQTELWRAEQPPPGLLERHIAAGVARAERKAREAKGRGDDALFRK